MELVKHTPEEQAAIEQDRARPHAVLLRSGFLMAPGSQSQMEQEIEKAMLGLKERADRSGMIILSTSISTNVTAVNGAPYFAVTVLCQWASLEKLEEQQRRAFLAGGGSPGRGR